MSMFKLVLRSFSNSLMANSPIAATATRPSTSIAIYHNTNSLLSNSLLSKLSNYSELPCTLHKYKDAKSDKILYNTTLTANKHKFNIDLKLNQTLSKKDFKFIIDECVDIHPDNRSILIQLLMNDASSNAAVNKSKLIKNFNIHDEKVVSYDTVKNNTIKFPIIIDYNNKLIANDETSFDRIMSNYSACGIQNFLQSKPVKNLVDEINSNGSGNHLLFKQAQAQSQQQLLPIMNQNLIHPHIAEFADLF